MNISVIAPVLNEIQFIGYSLMAAEPYVLEFVYALDEKSNDGTRELLHHIKEKYLGDRLVILDYPNFHPSDMKAYNASFNACIEKAKGDYCFFLHPDMIITEGEPLDGKALAYYTRITSFARDFNTVITKGRCDKWKNIHAKKFGLTYYGGYGSQNEDFYHSEITGKAYKHYGTEFSNYPFLVSDSHISINHYCELKPYTRRLEKMKECLKTLSPTASQEWIDEVSVQHPRVTLEQSCNRFGQFEFQEKEGLVPEVFAKYHDEFETFKKEPALA